LSNPHYLEKQTMTQALRLSPFFLLLLLAAAIVPWTRVQSAAPDVGKSTEAVVRDLAAEWSKAWLERDAAVLQRLWAEDFVYVEPSGRRFNKKEGLAGVKKSTEQLTSAVANSIDVRVYGGGTVAVDIGDFHEIGRNQEGKPFNRLSRFTNVWVLHGERWQCVSGHASNVSE